MPRFILLAIVLVLGDFALIIGSGWGHLFQVAMLSIVMLATYALGLKAGAEIERETREHIRLVLLVLSEEDSYGLAVCARIKERFGVHIPLGAIYPILRDLERNGVLKSYEGPPMSDRGGRSRRYYRLVKS